MHQKVANHFVHFTADLYVVSGRIW